MKSKKLITIGLSLFLSLSIVGCNNKDADKPKNDETKTVTPSGDENKQLDNDYVEKYSRFYGDYNTGLDDYKVYLSPQSTAQYYEKNEYPGNEAYLNNVKDAYKKSKEHIQTFIDELDNDINTNDKELTKMNEDLINQGKKKISNIDNRLKKLDEIPKESYNKSKEEFMKIVDDATTIDKDNRSDFDKVLDDMNKALGIDNNNDKMNNQNDKK